MCKKLFALFKKFYTAFTGYLTWKPYLSGTIAVGDFSMIGSVLKWVDDITLITWILLLWGILSPIVVLIWCKNIEDKKQLGVFNGLLEDIIKLRDKYHHESTEQISLEDARKYLNPSLEREFKTLTVALRDVGIGHPKSKDNQVRYEYLYRLAIQIGSENYDKAREIGEEYSRDYKNYEK